jgi:hypothetical protein
MSHETYGEDYYITPDMKVVALVEQISAWRNENLMLYSHDVFNMLIDHNLINKTEVESIISKIRDSKSKPVLPNQHLM